MCTCRTKVLLLSVFVLLLPDVVISMSGRMPKHTIFVTSESYRGNLGGLSGADSKCQTQAENAGLTGTWKAILSDRRNHAKDRIEINGWIYNTRNNIVAFSEADFWDGALYSPVLYTEDGETTPSYSFYGVWTGSDFTGRRDWYLLPFAPGAFCRDWRSMEYSASVMAIRGRQDESQREWVDDGAEFCVMKLHLYCISQPPPPT